MSKNELKMTCTQLMWRFQKDKLDYVRNNIKIIIFSSACRWQLSEAMQQRTNAHSLPIIFDSPSQTNYRLRAGGQKK